METWQVLGQRSGCSSCGKKQNTDPTECQANRIPGKRKQSDSRITAECIGINRTPSGYQSNTSRMSAVCWSNPSRILIEYKQHAYRIPAEYHHDANIKNINRIPAEYQQNTNQIPPEYQTRTSRL